MSVPWRVDTADGARRRVDPVDRVRLAILRRRATYLTERVARGDRGPVAAYHARTEADSLTWAIAIVERALGMIRDDQGQHADRG
jgi:hypothetical protein